MPASRPLSPSYHGGLPDYALHFVAEVTGRAPSVHNTQPWQLRAGQGGSVELHADLSRQLVHEDPDGRELYVSCGAALFGLRLAIGLLGYQPEVVLLPDGEDSTLLARATRGAATAVSAQDRALLAALTRRHTHRGAFTDEPVSPELLGRLRAVAASEGAELTVVEGERRLELARVVGAAERRQHHDPAYLAELRAWTGGPDDRSDGVPTRAFPDQSVLLREGDLPMRQFGPRPSTHDLPRAAGATTTAVLTTPGDTRREWLAAGAGLHHALLVAADEWVFASLHTQPLQLADLREDVAWVSGVTGDVQVLLTLGHAHTAPVTPRRSPESLYAEGPAPA